MKRIKYYLETTVFNFVFAEDDPIKEMLQKSCSKIGIILMVRCTFQI